MPQPGKIELVIYDLQGRKVRSLMSGRQKAAVHQVEWDGRDDAGAFAWPGVYLDRLIPMGRWDRRLVSASSRQR